MKFIRPRDVLGRIGVSRSTLWRMVRAGRFPAPIAITDRNVGYLEETVEAWMRARAQGLEWTPTTATVPLQSGFYRPPRNGDSHVAIRS